MPRFMRRAGALALVALGGLLAGCSTGIGEGVLDVLAALELDIGDRVTVIQDHDPRMGPLPAGLVGREETIIIADDADVIISITEQLVVEELPNITLLGIENDTGYDIYVRYAVDGAVQGVLVYEGETLLLEYPCLDAIELLSEEDFDPFTGAFVEEFDLTGIEFLNGLDFFCGEAVIVNIDPFGVDATIETVDLR